MIRRLQHGRDGKMKKKTGFVLAALFYIVFALSTFCSAADVTLAWDPNTEADLAGYRIYKTLTPDQYTFVKDDPDNNNKVWEGTAVTSTISVEEGQCWFVATAYDISGNESGPSNQVVYLMQPTNLCLTDMSEDNFDVCLDRRVVDQSFTVCWDLCDGATKYELKIVHYFYGGLETDSVEASDVCYAFVNLPKSSRHFEVKIRAVYPEGCSVWSSSANSGSPKNWLIYSKPAAPSW